MDDEELIAFMRKGGSTDAEINAVLQKRYAARNPAAVRSDATAAVSTATPETNTMDGAPLSVRLAIAAAGSREDQLKVAQKYLGPSARMTVRGLVYDGPDGAPRAVEPRIMGNTNLMANVGNILTAPRKLGTIVGGVAGGLLGTAVEPGLGTAVGAAGGGTFGNATGQLVQKAIAKIAGQPTIDTRTAGDVGFEGATAAKDALLYEVMGAGTGKALNAYSRGAARTAARDKAARAAGMDLTAGQTLDSPLLKTLESAAGATPTGHGQMVNAATKQSQQAAASAERVASKIAGGAELPTREEAGDLVIRAGQSVLDRLGTQRQTILGSLDAMHGSAARGIVGGAEVPATDQIGLTLQQIARQRQARVPGTEEIGLGLREASARIGAEFEGGLGARRAAFQQAVDAKFPATTTAPVTNAQALAAAQGNAEAGAALRADLREAMGQGLTMEQWAARPAAGSGPTNVMPLPALRAHVAALEAQATKESMKGEVLPALEEAKAILADAEAGRLTANDLLVTRTRLGQPSSGPLGPRVKGEAETKRLYGVLSEDIKGIAEAAGPEARAALAAHDASVISFREKGMLNPAGADFWNKIASAPTGTDAYNIAARYFKNPTAREAIQAKLTAEEFAPLAQRQAADAAPDLWRRLADTRTAQDAYTIASKLNSPEAIAALRAEVPPEVFGGLAARKFAEIGVDANGTLLPKKWLSQWNHAGFSPEMKAAWWGQGPAGELPPVFSMLESSLPAADPLGGVKRTIWSKLANARSPNAAMELFANNANNAAMVRTLRHVLPEEEFGRIAARDFLDLGRATPGAQTTVGDVFSPERLVTGWNKRTGIQSELYGVGAERALPTELPSLLSTADQIKSMVKLRNTSGTAPMLQGTQLLRDIGATTAGAVTGLVGAPQVGVGPGIGAGALGLSMGVPAAAAHLTTLPTHALGTTARLTAPLASDISAAVRKLYPFQ